MIVNMRRGWWGWWGWWGSDGGGVVVGIAGVRVIGELMWVRRVVVIGVVEFATFFFYVGVGCAYPCVVVFVAVCACVGLSMLQVCVDVAGVAGGGGGWWS